MRWSFRLSLVAVALPMAMLGSPAPAQATTITGGLIQGSGTISPALTATGTFGSAYSFSGTATGLPATIAANGFDLIGSIALGEGTVNLVAPFAANGVFVRVGAVVVATVANTTGPGAASGVFAFLPNPITVGGDVGSYTLIGAGGGLDSAPAVPPAFGGILLGGGTISPALTASGTFGSAYSFNGSVTGLSATVAASGFDLIGSIALGEGTVNLVAPFAANGVFVRVGAVVVAAVASTTPDAAGGVFAFLPNPITVGGDVGAYTLIGAGGGL